MKAKKQKIKTVKKVKVEPKKKVLPQKKKVATAQSKAKRVPWGRTLSTRDNYLGQSKTGSKKKRGVVVVDTHGENLAVVPLSSRKGKNRTELKGYGKKTKTYYKHYVETEDNEKQPIRVNQKFRENHKNMDVPREKVKEIRQTILTKGHTKQRNVKVLKEFHGEKQTKKMGVLSDSRAYKRIRNKPAAEQRPDRVKSRSLHSSVKRAKTNTRVTKPQPKVKPKTAPMKTEIVKKMPKGWKVTKGTNTQPRGTVFIDNGQSRFGGKFKQKLLIVDEKLFKERTKKK